MPSASAFACCLGLTFTTVASATSALAPASVPVDARALGVDAQEHLLSLAAHAEGDAYEQAIQVLVRSYAQTLPARVNASQFTNESWREDAVAAFALARLTQPAALEVLAQLPGLQPHQYLEARRPEPTALRDLRALRSQGRLHDLAVAEVLWKTRAGVSLSKPEDFPAAERKHFDGWHDTEYGALVDGLVMILGQSDERAAHFVLLDVMQNESFEVRHRALAAGALGQTGAAIAELPLLQASGDASERLRHGAWMGLGRLGSANAVAHLRSQLSVHAKTADFRVIVSALGRAGAQGARAGVNGREARADRAEIAIALVDALAFAKDSRDVTATIEAICVVGHEAALPALQRAATQGQHGERYLQAERRLRRALARLR